MTKILRSLMIAISAAFGALLLASCGAESLTEFGLERVLEAQADGEVDFDLDFDSGNFNISTEDGDFSIEADENGIFFDSDEGSGSVQFDEDGTIRFDTTEGGGVIQVDESGRIDFDTDFGDGTLDVDENGSMRLDSDFGNATVDVDDDGTVRIESEDGDFEMRIDEEAGISTFSDGNGGEVTVTSAVPADWPSYLPTPATLDADQSFFTVGNDEAGVNYSAMIVFDENEAYPDLLMGSLQAQGFETNGTTTSAQAGMATFEGTDSMVSMTWDDGFVFLSVTPG